MPSNYTQMMGAPQVGSVASEYTPDTERDANLIQRMGKSIKDFADVIKDPQDTSKDILGTISYELAEVENANIAYNQEYGNLIERMNSADQDAVAKAAKELSLLRAGQSQGKLTQAAAMTRTNDIIKRYTVMFPHLAKDIRAMGQESMGNVRQYAEQILGDDPVTKAATALATDAYAMNTTPAALARSRNAVRTSELTMADLNVRKAQGDLEKDDAIKGVAMAATAEAMAGTHELVISWNSQIATGQLSEQNITANIAALKDQLYRKHATSLASFGVNAEETKTAMGTALMILDNVETMLKAQGGTPEDKVRTLKLMSEMTTLKSEQDMVKYQERLNGLLGYLPPTESWAVVQAAAAILSSPISIDTPQGLEAWQNSARSALTTTNKATVANALRLAQSPEGQKIVAEMVGGLLSGTATPSGNPAVDAVANKQFDAIMGKLTDPAIRKQKVANGIGNFDWQDVMNMPNTRATIQNDPALIQIAANKAAQVAAAYITTNGLDPRKIKVDHNNFANPISVEGYKPTTLQGGQLSLTTTRDSAIEQLNTLYKQVLNSLGAEGVDKFLMDMGLDKPPKKARETADTKKKVTPKSEAPSEYKDVIGATESANNMPQGLLASLLRTESNFNPNAQGPLLDNGERAMGIAQIRPSAHPGVNYNDPNESIQYSGKYLSTLYSQFGSWEKAAAAYNWGPGNFSKVANKPNWRELLPDETKNYLRKIFG